MVIMQKSNKNHTWNIWKTLKIGIHISSTVLKGALLEFGRQRRTITKFHTHKFARITLLCCTWEVKRVRIDALLIWIKLEATGRFAVWEPLDETFHIRICNLIQCFSMNVKSLKKITLEDRVRLYKKILNMLLSLQLFVLKICSLEKSSKYCFRFGIIYYRNLRNTK